MREPRSVGYSLVVAVVVLVVALAIAAVAAPLVEITKPAKNSVVAGTADIEVTYTADGASPIVRVEVYIDGRPVKDFRLEEAQRQGRQSFRWDFSLATPSMHSISARAMDASGAVGTTGIQIKVQRGVQPAPAPGGSDRTSPTVDIYYPTEGAVVSGDVQVKADVTDNVGVRTVVFYLDGAFKKMMVNSPNYSYRTDSRKLADGPHVVAVRAFDADDNEGGAQVGFVVQNREATTTQTGETRIGREVPTVVEPVEARDDLHPPPVPAAVPTVSPAPVIIAPAAPDAGARSGATPGMSSSPVMRDTVAAATGPRTGTPAVAGLPLPKPVEVAPVVAAPVAEPMAAPPARAAAAVPETRKPVTSGLVAKVHADADAAMMVPIEPATVAAQPRVGDGAELNVPKLIAPATPEVVRIAKVIHDAGPARTAEPGEVASAPKIGDISRDTLVVLAPTPVPDEAVYADRPAGDVRDDRVAALPPRGDDVRPTSKIGTPGQLDIEAMSRFRDVKIVFDGKLIPLRSAPSVIDGVSIAPLREIFQSCDGVLYWYAADKRVKAVNPDIEMNLQIGNPVVNVNGTAEELVLAPYINNGRTMLPLEFVAATLDVTVSFNSSTGELIISSND